MPLNPNDLTMEEIDKLLCLNGKKYNVPKLVLKAVVAIESAMDPNAYRYEPAFFEKYLKNNPDWKNKDPKVVSASYGLFQIMLVVAHEIGFRGEAIDLYNPVINAELGAKLLRQILDKIPDKYKVNPIKHLIIAFCRYNGGSGGNPDSEGKLRNIGYANKVFKKYCELVLKEDDCVN